MPLAVLRGREGQNIPGLLCPGYISPNSLLTTSNGGFLFLASHIATYTPACLSVCFDLLETGLVFTAQAGLELTMLLPQLSQYQDYSDGSPSPAAYSLSSVSELHGSPVSHPSTGMITGTSVFCSGKEYC